MNKKMRIGISTGGGDCPGLNAAIRAVARSAILNYGADVIGIQDGFNGLLDTEKTRPLSILDVTGIIGLGGTILGTTNRGNPFKFPVAIGDQVEIRDLSGQIINNIEKLGLDAVVVVGGDGTQTIARDLWKLGAPIVGIPKTIDNDLLATDATIGYQTAVTIAVDAIDRLHTTARSHHRAMVVEVMGRYAGWIALEAGISGAVDVILIPEIPFTVAKICDFLQERIRMGRMYSIIVVAEGARASGEQVMVQSSESHGMASVERLGGIGNHISEAIEQQSGIESRCVVLGHLQRGGPPVHFDRLLATRMGILATELAVQKKFGMMTSLRGKAVIPVPLDEAVQQIRFVRPDSETVQAARRIGINFGD